MYEDYEHFYFSCSYNSNFLSKISNLLKFIGFNESILNIENLVVGYKINDEAYYEINFLLTVIFFSIYKSYYISDSRRTKVDIFKIFKAEIKSIVEINNIIKRKTSKLILKTLNYINDHK